MSARILILEDDQQLRNVMQTVLESQGYNVETASNGLEAVQKTLETTFDLIIADIRMEGIDGLEALKQAKQQQPELGSLVVSGYSTPEETARAAALDVGGYLKKPIKMNVLLEHVRRLVADKASVTREAAESHQDRDLLLWSLQTAVSATDSSGQVGPEGWLEEVGRLTRGMARFLKLNPQVTKELSLGASLKVMLKEVPESLRGSKLLPTFQVIFAHKIEDSEPFEQTLVGLVVAAAEQLREAEAWPSREALQERYQGRFSDQLLDAYEASKDEDYQDETPVVQSAPSGASAYSLSQALERAGDHHRASIAYAKIAEAKSETELGTNALIRAGSLARRLGKFEEAIKSSQLAYDWSRRLGPKTRARAVLELGLSITEQDDAAGRLTEALNYFQSLGLWPEWCRALAGLHRRGLEITTDSKARFLDSVLASDSQILAQENGVVIPLLLEIIRTSEQSVTRRCTIALSLFPRAVLSQLDLLCESDRCTVVELFQQSGIPCPSPIRSRLLKDSSGRVQELAKTLRAGESEVVQATSLRFYSLGVFQVFRGEANIEDKAFKTQKNKYFLAALLSDSAKPKVAEQLTETFWPNKDERKSKYSLNWALTTIRGAIRQPGSKVVLRKAGRLMIDPDVDWWHDVDELEKAITAGQASQKRGEAAVACAHYRKAADLYQGQYLEGCYLDWAISKRDRINSVMGETLLSFAELSRGNGELEEAISAVSQLLDFQPHHQKAHLNLVQLLTEDSRPEAAIKHYRKCEEMLRLEYELEPSTELVKAYHEARMKL